MKLVLEKLFSLEENHTTLAKEFFAALTTFSTMIYIIFVNPQILKEAGMDSGAVMVATILVTAFASILIGLWANYPFALAPGMGINAFIAYSLVIEKNIPWQIALGVSFWSGFIFFLLNLLKAREKIVHILPNDLRVGTAAGIGLFLSIIGMKSVNFFVSNPNTLLSLGNLHDPAIILTLFGVILLASLLSKEIPGAVLITLFLLWIAGLLFGLTQWQGLFASPPSLSPTFLKLDLLGALQPELLPIIVALVFVAIFDTTGSLSALAEHGNLYTPCGKIPRLQKAMDCDALGTMASACLGSTPITTYLESATGMTAGGKTGLTAIFVGLLFLITLFIAPLAASIPPFATAPALIVIGAMMLKGVVKLNWKDPSDFIPAFIILITIPLTFSISSGIALGFICYALGKIFCGKGKQVHWMVYLIALLFCIKFWFDPAS
jgi:AGZA family xanthine/uracil permease-like MFS transporter